MMEITKRLFGYVKNKPVIAFQLKNDHGIKMTCLNYGCVISELIVPDKDGKFENIVLGFDHIEDYIKYSPYFGAVVGRVAGRIKDAEFELNGKVYKLSKNENGNQLHGGDHGFHHVIWNGSTIEREDAVGAEFSYSSADGEEGYPGNLEIQVTYLLTNNQELLITYRGKTDKKTIVNVTNHSYFNLSGNLKRDVKEHTLQLDSDQFLELDKELLPTGKKLNVDGTVFDFRHGRKIRDGIESRHPQNVLVGNGYDHPFLLKGDKNPIILQDQESGRILEVETDQPAVVLYTSNSLTDDFSIRGRRSKKYLGVCLETQGVPDAIHHPEFPSVVLNPGEEYTARTKYAFRV